MQDLKNYIEAIESLHAQKQELADKITEIYSAMKRQDMDPKVVRLIIKQRKMSKFELEEQEQLLDHYKSILGM